MARIDSLGKPEGVERLAEVLLTWVEVDKHQSLGVSTQRVHQQMGQLGVPVGDQVVLSDVLEDLVVPEGLQDPPQDQERCVDVTRLLLSVPRVQRLLDPLRACQVAVLATNSIFFCLLFVKTH